MTQPDTQIRTLIVDDEPHALQIIRKYAANVPELEVIGTCSNAMQAAQVLRQQAVDLLFIDIKMPGLLGTDLVRSLKNPPKTVFTTAYHEYAVEGFNLDAVDYLVKPIPLNRFLRAVDKVMHALRGDRAPAVYAQPRETPVQPAARHYLYLRIDRQSIKVDTADIHWIESVRDYIRVVTKEKTYMTKQKISVAEKLLPMGRFLRVHRSFIIPVDSVEGYNPNYVIVAGKKVPIGRNYKQACQEHFGPGGETAE
ncbi:LytR/AlgR family response regulator transcription factor [Chitinophaga rhizosphaerae]|uniref:LytR/AlgR family response regulator transcription factor n=1 Tax=Chitinophaga rhizosphaerae TaxID=1864947 RepID=UPI000F7FF5A7|nr:response regulator transcription factor [Chitinophaga rhizosphaerae]